MKKVVRLYDCVNKKPCTISVRIVRDGLRLKRVVSRWQDIVCGHINSATDEKCGFCVHRREDCGSSNR